MWVDRPLEEVFDFFADARNLEVITPPWLHFRHVSDASIAMAEGVIIDHRLALHGVPMRWRSRISVWEPPHRFVDEQLRGPYRKWIHEHSFSAERGGTRVADRVQYLAPGWFLEPLVHRFFVRRSVQRVFQYRQSKLEEIFGSAR